MIIAENKRKQQEEADRIKREQEQNKPTNVVISAPKTNGNTTQTKVAEEKEVKMEGNYFYSSRADESMVYNYHSTLSHYRDRHNIHNQYSKGFTINGKQYFDGKYRACIGLLIDSDGTLFYPNQLFPPNVGIVVLDEGNKENLVMDIIDINGNRLFNDPKIYRIQHIYKNFFLIERGTYGPRPMVEQSDEVGPAFIYNLETKKKQNIVNFSYVNNYRPVTEANVGPVYSGPLSYYSDWSIECVNYFECKPEYSGSGPNHAYCFTKDGKIELYQLERNSNKKVFRHLKTLDFK